MSRINNFYEEVFPEDIDLSVKYSDSKQASAKKRLKVRRKVEDIREQRRLQRQLDPYAKDY